MEGCRDFIQWLGPGMSMRVLRCLDDTADLVHVASVSSSWHRFVIANGLSKQLCLRMFPEISSVANVIEVKNTVEIGPGNSMEWECLERDHRVYSLLARCLTNFRRKDCISEAISASSTDFFPEESIENTLEPIDRIFYGPSYWSYWSSKGNSDATVPETLIYKLTAKWCVVTEIHIQPFQAYFQSGSPIYSAKAVRFRMGHPKPTMEIECNTR